MTRLLVLTLYYPPDLSAGSFRATALVEALKTQAPGAAIDVITSLPNRYRSFSTAAPEHESDGPVTIRRVPMPAHRSDMLTQATSYARFALKASRLARAGRYDLVFATSSRLMTATLGAWVSRRSGAPLYLDIRDLFTDTMRDILSPRVAPLVVPLLSGVERWTMQRAMKVNLVSPGFEPYFAQRYPELPLAFFTNGIDDDFLEPDGDDPPAAGGRPLTVVYAGNIGEGQGLHAIIPALAARLADRVRFRVIGDGGRRAHLADAVARAGLTNVDLVPPMSRAGLRDEYRAADVLFLHLNSHPAFTRVLPSKIFEYGALGRPIWAGVGGYAADFLRAEVSNAAVFDPCDVEGGMLAWERLDFGRTRRDTFVRRYTRRDIMRGLASDIVAHVPQELNR